MTFLRFSCALLFVVSAARLCSAQQALPPVVNAKTLFAARPMELGAFAEGGFGVQQNSDDKFFSLGVHAGKVLTPPVGPGLLRGQFEIGVEVLPFWQAYTPQFPNSHTQYAGRLPSVDCPVGTCTIGGGTFTGFSIVPANFRWDFTSGKRFVPWIQGAGGVIYTTHKFPSPPSDTSVWNFSPQFGVGTHYFLKPRRSLDFSANAEHISSASLGDKNPGINASVQFTVGYTWWK